MAEGALFYQAPLAAEINLPKIQNFATAAAELRDRVEALGLDQTAEGQIILLRSLVSDSVVILPTPPAIEAWLIARWSQPEVNPETGQPEFWDEVESFSCYLQLAYDCRWANGPLDDQITPELEQAAVSMLLDMANGQSGGMRAKMRAVLAEIAAYR